MASTYLTRAATGSITSDKTFTMSVWLKRSSITGSGSADHWFMHENASSHSQKLDLHFCDDEFRMGWYDGSSEYNLDSKMKFRDTNAWYHIVFRCDTTQATASNRVRLYVNGEQAELQQIGGGSPDAQQPAQNATMNLGQKIICIGRYQASSPSQYFNGCMSHMHYCDGQSYAPTEFGSTDTTTGEWKIKADPSLTYGNNGFWLFKDDNALTNRASGTSSGNFTLAGGTLTKTEDNPSNVFATMNPLDNYTQGSTFTAGNTKLEWNTNNRCNFGTFIFNKGKFYWEMKYANASGGTDAMIGVALAETRQGDDYPGHDGTAWSYYASNGNKYHSGGASYGNSWAANNIIGVAFDADTRTIWFSKDGVWQNSATISEIAAGTTTNSAYTGMGSAGDFFIPCMSGYDGNKAEFNFGNGYFSTTAISSAGTNASGTGLFEYDVPTNFTSLSTKGLNI